MSDEQGLQSSSTTKVVTVQETSSAQQDNVETGGVRVPLIIALCCLIPIFWPVFPCYLAYKCRYQYSKLIDIEAPPDENARTDGKFESSQPLSQPSDNSTMCPAAITCSFTTEKDYTTTMTLSTEPRVDGTFQYKLDNDDSFKPCSSRQTLSRLSAGTHNIEIKFMPSNFSDFSTSKTHQFNVEPIAYGSVSVTEDTSTATIKLYSNVEGTFNCSLDGKPLQQCYDELTTDELPIGHHYFYVEFTKTGSSKPFYEEPFNFFIRPTIVCEVVPDNNSVKMKLDTKQNIDGAFWYSLDDNKPFQQCSSGHTLSNLSAGVHDITFKFIPTDFSDHYIVSKNHQFEIKPTAYGSVSAEEDTATIKLYSDVEGSFKCYLDGTPLNQCKVDYKYMHMYMLSCIYEP